LRILVLDIELMGLDFCLRCAAAGHDVRLYRHMPKRRERYGEGFKEIALVDDWRGSMEWAREGLIVLTGNYTLLHELARYRDFGYPIFAPTAASARLEIDRMAGMMAADAAGLSIPEYHTFAGLEETRKFNRKSDRAYVFKPSGDEENKDMTFVASDPAELDEWLGRQIAAGKQMKQCLLQEKVEVLSELGISGWMGPEGFLPDRCGLSIEHKKLCDGENGPTTGEMATCGQYVEDDKLADEMLKPFEPILRTLGHRGDFSVGAIIDTTGKAWFLEVTARFGFPAWWMQTASHKGDPAKWMKDLLDGKDSLKVSYDVALVVVCAQPPFPYGHDVPVAMVEGNPITGVDDFPDQVHLASVMKGRGSRFEGGKIVQGEAYQTTAPYVLVCTGLGKTVTKARERVYAAVNGVKFPGKIIRTDAGEKVIKALPALHKHGYALDMEP
jgi:phosphoribosylamine--glycine ligase